jgi:ABC-type thiamine transport system substrate-binding protein
VDIGYISILYDTVKKTDKRHKITLQKLQKETPFEGF